jgi:hypothetical protein
VRDWQRWSGARDDGVQRMAVSQLGELRPRPGRCAGRSRAVWEELQCGDCGRIRTVAVGFLLGINVLVGVRADARQVAVEMAPVRAGFIFREGRGGECDLAQDRQLARLVSASACVQETIGHARASQGPVERERSAGGGGRPTRVASQQAERAAELHLVQAGVAHRGCGQARRPCG